MRDLETDEDVFDLIEERVEQLKDPSENPAHDLEICDSEAYLQDSVAGGIYELTRILALIDSERYKQEVQSISLDEGEVSDQR